MPDLITSPCGCKLTHEQAATVRARLHAAMRTTHSGGRGPRHTCSDPASCQVCRRTEAQRKYRAKQARGGDGAILAV
jgi:hypothetical protein